MNGITFTSIYKWYCLIWQKCIVNWRINLDWSLPHPHTYRHFWKNVGTFLYWIMDFLAWILNQCQAGILPVHTSIMFSYCGPKYTCKPLGISNEILNECTTSPVCISIFLILASVAITLECQVLANRHVNLWQTTFKEPNFCLCSNGDSNPKFGLLSDKIKMCELNRGGKQLINCRLPQAVQQLIFNWMFFGE